MTEVIWTGVYIAEQLQSFHARERQTYILSAVFGWVESSVRYKVVMIAASTLKLQLA